MTFKENETYDLESYLGVDKSDHNLEDQIDNLVNEIKLLIDKKNHKKDFIENYNYCAYKLYKTLLYLYCKTQNNHLTYYILIDFL